MTTKYSSLRELKAQADYIAKVLKASERGEVVFVKFAEKIAAARSKECFKVSIIMDDKVIVLEIPWTTISSTEEAALSVYIMEKMRETRNVLH